MFICIKLVSWGFGEDDFEILQAVRTRLFGNTCTFPGPRSAVEQCTEATMIW